MDNETNNTCSCCDYHGLEKGDTLYVSSSWDGGIGFDYINNIRYCPVCGKELPESRLQELRDRLKQVQN